MKFIAWIAALLGLVLVWRFACVEDDVVAESGETFELSPSNAANLSGSESFRVAYWQGVLAQHPDLPEKVGAVLGEGRVYPNRTNAPGSSSVVGQPEAPLPADGLDAAAERSSTEAAPDSVVEFHTGEGAVVARASTIDVLITDVSDRGLRDLLEFLEAIPRRAKELGLPEPRAPDAVSGDGPRILVIGSVNKIKVRGKGGSEHQEVQILASPLESSMRLRVHGFGARGREAVGSLPPTFVAAGHGARPPPPEALHVVVLSPVSDLHVEGPRESARQEVTFSEWVRGHDSKAAILLAGLAAQTVYSTRSGPAPGGSSGSRRAGPSEPGTRPGSPARPEGPSGGSTGRGTSPGPKPPIYRPPTPRPVVRPVPR